MFVQFSKIETLLVAMCISLLVAFIAGRKGRGFFYWLIYGHLFSLIALIHVLLSKSLRNYSAQETLKEPKYKHALSIIGQNLKLFAIIYLCWGLVIGCGSPKYKVTDYDTLTPAYNEKAFYVMERKERSFDNIWSFWEHFSGSVLTLDESFRFYKVNPETKESRLIYTINTSPYFFRFGGYYGWGATINSRVFKPYRPKFIGGLPNQEGLLCWWQYPKRKSWFINYDLSTTKVNNEVAVIRQNSITPIFKLNDYDNFKMMRWCENGDSFYCEVTRVLTKAAQTASTIKKEYFLINLNGSAEKLDIENKNNAPIEITPDGKYLFVLDKNEIIRLEGANQNSEIIDIPSSYEVCDLTISPNGQFLSYSRYLVKEQYRERKAFYIYDIEKMLEIPLGENIGEAKWSFLGDFFIINRPAVGPVIFDAQTLEVRVGRCPDSSSFAGSYWSCDDASVIMVSKPKENSDYKVFSGILIRNNDRELKKVLIKRENFYNAKSNLLIRQWKGYCWLLLGTYMDSYGEPTLINFQYIGGGIAAYNKDFKNIDFMTISPFGKFIYYGKFLPISRYIRELNIIDTDNNKTQEFKMSRDTLIDWDSIEFY